MAISNIKAEFNCDIEKVWDIIVSLNNYSWRSDIKDIQIISKNKFVEHTKNGYSTMFTITAFEPYKRYEFDIENNNIYGHWIGLFSHKQGITTIDFTETIKAKKFFIKPFVKSYLKKQQDLYISDLNKALKN